MSELDFLDEINLAADRKDNIKHFRGGIKLARRRLKDANWRAALSRYQRTSKAKITLAGKKLICKPTDPREAKNLSSKLI